MKTLASTPVSLGICAAFLALITLVIAFLIYRKRNSLDKSCNQSIQQIVSHGSLFASRCTQTKLAAAQPKAAPMQAPSVNSSQCAGAGAVCTIQQQLCPSGQTMMRPQGFAKPTAIKSPNSGYIKKSPSPTDVKSPPREMNTTNSIIANSNTINANNTVTSATAILGMAIMKSSMQNLPNDTCSNNPSQDKESTQLNVQSKQENIDFKTGNIISKTLVNAPKNQSSNVIKNLSNNNLESDPTLDEPMCTGRLHFKMRYSYEKTALIVNLIKCEQLKSKGTIDPYVKIQLLPERSTKVKTKVIRKTNSPVFDEDFVFCSVNACELDSLTLHFTVVSFDRYSRNELIGECVHHLDKAYFDTLDKQTFFIKEIYPKGGRSKTWGRGELLLSLCYQPAANRLTAVILKAKNLPKMDLTGLSDPYVKAHLIHKGQTIAKKKTHVKKRTLNPVFNESFVFDLPVNKSGNKQQIKQFNDENEEISLLPEFTLELVLRDYDRMSRNELIGQITLSHDADDVIARKHWEDMCKNPRRQIAEWHRLKMDE